MKISRNFDLSEFACNDGTDVPAEYLPNVISLAKNLQVLRDALKKPVTINSGYRSPAYNAKIAGAASKSQHLLAKAADIRVSGLLAIEVYNVILRLIEQGKMHNGGVGLYDTFVHYDVRPTSARWDFRKKK
jgi:uncharacterized protein YcbK (DUF882 family)